ncbi:THAP domain-containing protein 1-like isoform X2 [Metopolophium dirhodum]|uniref:THAP domain-containing protein 1-like isoform X2 n=1 Tax=Metopolophium dirhodum TaxID=44670 RepID=UPI00298F926F|nr:THAP domain-containing protein 1-like isoform X2 [Metopolophium dirhodum]
MLVILTFYFILIYKIIFGLMAPKKSYSACIFCLNSPYKKPSISLHSFPKDQSRRSLWLTACGLTEEDYKPSRKLCSQHFKRDCYKTGTRLNILKPNSVPTKLNKHAKEFFESTYRCIHKMPEISSRKVPELLTSQIDEQTVSTVKLEPASTVKLEPVSTVKLEPVSIVKLEPVSDCEMETSPIDDTFEQKSHIYYEGDETTPDLATWREAKRNFTKARCQVIEQRKKIKYLNLKVSRLHKRLSSMAKSLNDLKKKKIFQLNKLRVLLCSM